MKDWQYDTRAGDHFFRSRRNLMLENLALRQQLTVLSARHPHPRFAVPDRLFWVILRRFWSGWRNALVVVQPETVIGWHRTGFKLYWTWLSRSSPSRTESTTSLELREVIFKMVAENRTWGAPRIHGELRMLGFEISERTVLRWMRKAPRDPEPAQRLGSVPEQSSRGHRCNGFLHRSDAQPSACCIASS